MTFLPLVLPSTDATPAPRETRPTFTRSHPRPLAGSMACPWSAWSACSPRLAALTLAVLASGLAPRAGWAQAEAVADTREGSGLRTLAPVTVTAPVIRSATTEGSDNYAAPLSTVGRTPVAPKDLPQSVTTVTRQQLDDMRIDSLETAMKQVTGVTVVRYDASGYYNEFYTRGYPSSTYQIDNVALQTDGNGTYLDLAAFDRVEVLRGPAGLYSGAGEPGVAVNLARKRALNTLQLDAALSLARWNMRRGELDLTGPLIESGRIRGRLVAVAQANDTFMKNVDGRKQMVYGTVEVDLAERTTLSLGTTWQDVRSVLSRGLPTWRDGTLINLPRSSMPVLSWNQQRLMTHDSFAELEHRTLADARIKLTLRRSQRSNDASFTDPSPPDADGWMRDLTSSAFARRDQDTTADLHLDTPLRWGSRTHNLLVGMDWRTTDDRTRYAPYPGTPMGAINLFDPDPDAFAKPAFDLDANVSRVKERTRGFYGQLRFKATDDLTLVGGGRWSWWQSSGSSWGSDQNYAVRSEFTPYAAVLHALTPRLSAYASYSQIFVPQNYLTADGAPIKPRTGTQVELGIKGDTADGRLQYSAALFHLIDRNRGLADLNNEPFYVAGGKVRSQGFEMQAQGRLSTQWSLVAGYAYTATRYLEDAEASGTFNSLTPRHNLNLWARYDVPERLVHGLDLGAGLRAVSRFYSESGAITVNASGYALVALRAGYQINRQVSLALNVNNLFDRVYWEKVSYPGRQNFYGEPRNVMLTLRASL